VGELGKSGVWRRKEKRKKGETQNISEKQSDLRVNRVLA
jgi:hypothetical protein